MKVSKANLKKALRECRSQKESIEATKLANAVTNDINHFWSLINTKQCKKTCAKVVAGC